MPKSGQNVSFYSRSDEGLSGGLCRSAPLYSIGNDYARHVIFRPSVDWPSLDQIMKSFGRAADGFRRAVPNSYINRRYPLYSVVPLLDIHSRLRAILRRHTAILQKIVGEKTRKFVLVLGLVDRPEAFQPSSEALAEHVRKVRTGERVKSVEGSLSTFLDNSSPSLIAERGGSSFHDGLRTEARAQASPSRREIGDTSEVERQSDIAMMARPQTSAKGSDGGQPAWCQPPSMVSHGVFGRTHQIGHVELEGNISRENHSNAEDGR